MKRLRVSPPVLLPGACLAALLGISAAFAVRVVRPVMLPNPGPEAPDPRRASPRPAPRAEPASGLDAAVTVDPFRPERRPSPVAFRMPGEALAGPDTNQPQAAQAIVLIGTAVEGGGGFAMCQIGSEPPRLVRLGERLAGYTLRAVGQGRATFRTATGQVIEVRVPKAGT